MTAEVGYNRSASRVLHKMPSTHEECMIASLDRKTSVTVQEPASTALTDSLIPLTASHE